MSPRLAVIGAGVMGEALARGLIASGWAPSDVVLSDVRKDRLSELAETLGVAVTDGNAEASSVATDGVLLAVKPQEAPAALESIAPVLSGSRLCLLSIVAGLTTAAMRERCPDAAAVRAMPNMPARVQRGVTALAAAATAGPDHRLLASEVFGAVGRVIWVDERQMDAVTAVSGSGPAYVFLLAEAMTDAARTLGLEDETASLLASATIEGAGAMMLSGAAPPDVLRQQVTSPGGTTAAALSVLDERGVREALVDAVRAAAARSAELGAEAAR